MKKLIFSIAAMAIMGAASYAALKTNNSEREFTALELANIEALTTPEGTYPRRFKCYTSFVYSEGDAVVDCSTCEKYEDHSDAWYNIHDYCYK